MNPVLFWLVFVQLFGGAILLLIQQKYGTGIQVYHESQILIISLCNLFLVILGAWFYKKDALRRKEGCIVHGKIPLGIKEVCNLLFIGAGGSQIGNIFLSIIQMITKDFSYQESMGQATNGKSIWFLILTMGIIGPIAEEVIFRWLMYLRLRDYFGVWISAIVSGLVFGIYHGNFIQGIYAFILGVVFALVFECTGNLWSCVLLHAGANIWSLIYPRLALSLMDAPYFQILFWVLLALVMGAVMSIFRLVNRRKSYPGRRI